MPKFAANLTMLWNEVDFLDRFAAAAKAGFSAVEYLFPYPYPKEQLAERLAQAQARRRCCTTCRPATGRRASAASRACRIASASSGTASASAIDYATALWLQAGQLSRRHRAAGRATRPEVRETFVDNLKFAAPTLAAAGIRLLIEPINTRDIPGFYLNHTAQAIDIIDAVGSTTCCCSTTSITCRSWKATSRRPSRQHHARIAHVQIADNPGRNEPGTGEINYRFLFDFIDRSATTAGSAASTSRRPRPPRASAGSSRTSRPKRPAAHQLLSERSRRR